MTYLRDEHLLAYNTDYEKTTRGDRTGVTMLSMIDDIFIIIPVPLISPFLRTNSLCYPQLFHLVRSCHEHLFHFVGYEPSLLDRKPLVDWGYESL